MIPDWTPGPELSPDRNLCLSLDDSSSHPRSGTALRCLALTSSACRHRPLVDHPSPFPQGGWDGRGEAAARASHPARAPDVTPVHPGVPQLLAMVQRQVPGARLVEDLPHELVLVLPYGGALDGSFTQLFHELDQHLGELGLASYGISDTSLEEVWQLREGCLEEVVLRRGAY